MKTKKCTKCGKTKDVCSRFFYKSSKIKDGYKSRCKDCIRSTKQTANTNKKILKTCNSCKKELSATKDYFHVSKLGQYGVSGSCKNCVNTKQRQKENTPNSDKGITRECVVCHTIRPATIEFFHKNNKSPDGLCSSCKDCRNSHNRNYAKQNTNRINIKNNSYRKRRIQEDPSYRVSCSLRTRLHAFLNGKIKSDKTLNLIGCSLEDFVKHLENQFDDEMSWDNYGEYWQIDHIIPLSYYDSTKLDHQEKLMNYRNCRPLEKTKNIIKSGELDIELIKKYNIQDLL